MTDTITVTDHVPASLAVLDLSYARKSQLEIIAAFAKRLATDPSGAFKWSEKAIEAAGRLHVIDWCLAHLTENHGDHFEVAPRAKAEESAVFLTRYASDEVLRFARYGRDSLSSLGPCEQAAMSAWADLADPSPRSSVCGLGGVRRLAQQGGAR